MDPQRWHKLEAKMTWNRIAEIPPGGLHAATIQDELQAYHRQIFQDCYSWAGELRTFNMTKPNPLSSHPSTFAHWTSISTRLAELDPLRDNLIEAEYEQKIEVLSYLHSELNEIHPFREGNGRTTRAFMENLAARVDVTIEWPTERGTLNYVSAASMRGDSLDSSPWHTLYSQICTRATWDDETDSYELFDLLTPLNEAGQEITHGASILDTLGLPVAGALLQVQSQEPGAEETPSQDISINYADQTLQQ